MTGKKFSPARRAALKASLALASGAGLGFPPLLAAQSDAIRIGHLTPRTGFLGQIGEYGAYQALVDDPGSRFSRLLQTGLEEVLA